MAGFSFLVARTRLGRNMRACEQDLKMAALVGIDVDRTISLTFVIGAALAAVAGLMFLLYYGVIDFFIGFLAGVKAFTAAVLGGIGSLPGAMLGGILIGLIETMWSAYFSIEYKDVAAFSILIIVLIFLPTGILGPAGSRKGVRSGGRVPRDSEPSRPPRYLAAVKEAAIAAAGRVRPVRADDRHPHRPGTDRRAGDHDALRRCWPNSSPRSSSAGWFSRCYAAKRNLSLERLMPASVKDGGGGACPLRHARPSSSSRSSFRSCSTATVICSISPS